VIQGAVTKANISAFVEDYIIFQIDGFVEPVVTAELSTRYAQQLAQILRAERVFFDRHECEPVAAGRIGAPCSPRREEVAAHAETGLDHGEKAACAPALGYAVPVQEDVVRLGQRPRGAVIDVAVHRGKRRAVVAKSQGGGNQLGAHRQAESVGKRGIRA